MRSPMRVTPNRKPLTHVCQALDVGGGVAHDVQVAVLLVRVAPHELRFLLCSTQVLQVEVLQLWAAEATAAALCSTM